MNMVNTNQLPINDNAVHVDINRLDSLLNLVGELIINKSTFLELSRQARATYGFRDQVFELTETVEQLEQVVEAIQGRVIASRMVPVEQLFVRFRPLVEKFHHSGEKRVALETYGHETEMDKKIIDELSEPMVHIVRNSFDHGIETLEEREAAGKPPEGRIRLTASREHNKLKVQVSDDGRGVDCDAVRRVAVERGIATVEDAAQMPDEQVRQLIFHSGFSTRSEVSQMSGRGVGMHAARRRVESLGGTVDVESIRGEGTTMTILLPLTMAIIPGLFLKVGGETFALPVEAVEETLIVKPEDVDTVEQREVIHLRGNAVPVMRLDDLLQLEGNQQRGGYGVIVMTRYARICLLVDRLLRREDIVIKSPGAGLSALPHIAGATITGEGHVVMILDPDAFSVAMPVATDGGATC